MIEQGNEITFRTLSAGQIRRRIHPAGSQAALGIGCGSDSAHALVLQRDDFLRLLQERPLVGIELMRSLAERIRYTTSYLERLYDALELLSNSEYDEAIREMALSSDEDEMQNPDHDLSGDGTSGSGT